MDRPDAPPSTQPVSQPTLAERLQQLEARQNQDDADKKRERFYKQIALVVSICACLLSLGGVAIAFYSARLSAQQAAAREKETLPFLDVSVLRVGYMVALYEDTDSGGTRNFGFSTVLFRVVNRGAPTSIEDIVVSSELAPWPPSEGRVVANINQSGHYISSEGYCMIHPGEPVPEVCQHFSTKEVPRLTLPHRIERHEGVIIAVPVRDDFDAGTLFLRTTTGHITAIALRN